MGVIDGVVPASRTTGENEFIVASVGGGEDKAQLGTGPAHRPRSGTTRTRLLVSMQGERLLLLSSASGRICSEMCTKVSGMRYL
jgi:hypothetical protein